MIYIKNFSASLGEQKSHLLRQLELESSLGWSTVSPPMDESQQALARLVVLVYDTLKGARDGD